MKRAPGTYKSYTEHFNDQTGLHFCKSTSAKMPLPLLLRILLLLFFLISMCNSNQMRNVKAVINGDFQNKKVTEIPAKTLTVRSKAECVIECKKSPSCLSFSFNDDSKECYIFDKDFVNVANTQTADEIGWSYYYVVLGNTLDRTKCQLPTVGICHSFCFFYINGFSSNTAQDFIQACTDEGGEVMKVDRYLKQYCMEQAVDQVIGNDFMAINGVQNETTGKWTYLDGTEMTYFNWDVYFVRPQPDYVSPIVTPGNYEGYIGTKKSFNYLWHDVTDWYCTSHLCEIK